MGKRFLGQQWIVRYQGWQKNSLTDQSAKDASNTKYCKTFTKNFQTPCVYDYIYDDDIAV